MNITGLHHVTAIASDPQRNLDFYVGVLGLRLVKRTVNFDDPGSYHFYFADANGSPGTVITFFPWPNARRGRPGAGEVAATAFAIPEASVDYWLRRLSAHHVPAERAGRRFGANVIRLADPDGLRVELIPSPIPAAGQPWARSAVPAEHALRGFHGVTLALDDLEPTARLLTEAFGYRLAGEAGDRVRLSSADENAPGNCVDLLRLSPGAPAGTAAGSVHHVAFRAADDDVQATFRRELGARGFGVSPVMDRTYFHSIYFREPGGVLFEIATDTPGFAIDESPERLGEELRLPSWMESSRPRIEAVLPPITLPRAA